MRLVLNAAASPTHPPNPVYACTHDLPFDPIQSCLLQADNRRLVALLGATKEWKRLGRELAGQAAGAVPASEETAGGGDGMSAGGGGGQGPYQELGALHYVPVEEVVMHKVRRRRVCRA
jgi:hypothetical protein